MNKFISPLPRQCEEAFIIRPPFGLPEAAAIAAVRCHHKDEPVGHSGTAASRPQRSEASHAAPGRSGNSPRATRGSFGKPRKAPSGPEPPLPAAPPSTPASPRAHTPCVPSPGLAAGARSRRFLPEGAGRLGEYRQFLCHQALPLQPDQLGNASIYYKGRPQSPSV